MSERPEEQIALERFLTYLRIPTVQPEPDYEPAMKFLQDYAEELGLEFKRFTICENNPVAFLTWKGYGEYEGSIILNSHMDVVPVEEEKWTYPPFDAHITDDGWIYARGTQDMKCVGIQYLEAVRRLKEKKFTPERDMVLIFVPDEEMGGFKGMIPLVKHPDFKALKPLLALDEGLATPGDEFNAYMGERGPWWVEVVAKGNPGHGSLFIKDTAAIKIHKVMSKFLAFREHQERELALKKEATIGDVISVNMTRIWGGKQTNVIPSEMTACFDCRVPPTVDLNAFKAMIQEWCEEAGEGVTPHYQQETWGQSITTQNSVWFRSFAAAVEGFGSPLKIPIFPGATDSRFMRDSGIPCINFSPMRLTPILLHDHNERLHKEVFFQGVRIFEAILKSLGKITAIDGN